MLPYNEPQKLDQKKLIDPTKRVKFCQKESGLMKRRLKTYEASFKAKVALEAYKGNKSVLEICTSYNIPRTNVSDWEQKLVSEASNIFVATTEKDKQVKQLKNEIEKLHKIIGEITIENNYFKKKLLI